MCGFANVYEEQVKDSVGSGCSQLSQVQMEIEKLAKSISVLGDKVKGIEDRFKSVLSDIGSEPSDKNSKTMQIPILVPLASTLSKLNSDLGGSIGRLQSIVNRTQL